MFNYACSNKRIEANIKKIGFTLAEVLITLGIIGIVAAITIPTLMKNYQKVQYVSAAKKAYSQMNQVLQQMAADDGTVGSIVSSFADSSDVVGAKIASYYKVLKTCPTTQTDEECFAKYDDNYDGSAKTTSNWTIDVKNYYKFITTDGMSISIGSFANGCTTNRGFDAAPDAPVTNHTCGWVNFDVNGKAKPNYSGRDVFMFYITSNKTPMLYPYGGFYFAYTANSGTLASGGSYWWNYSNNNYCGAGGKSGYFCSGRLMEKGWYMDW